MRRRGQPECLGRQGGQYLCAAWVCPQVAGGGGFDCLSNRALCQNGNTSAGVLRSRSGTRSVARLATTEREERRGSSMALSKVPGRHPSCSLGSRAVHDEPRLPVRQSRNEGAHTLSPFHGGPARLWIGAVLDEPRVPVRQLTVRRLAHPSPLRYSQGIPPWGFQLLVAGSWVTLRRLNRLPGADP